MKLELQLYVRRHRSGFFTVRVLGDRPLELFTDDLEQAREDLELVVSDLVDRSHPSRQSAFALTVAPEPHILEVLELLTVHYSDQSKKISGEFTALVADGQSWRNVWLPRLDLHVFVKNRRRAWQDDAAELIHRHFSRLSEGAQLALRLDAEEWIETFEVSADPPPLTKFVGKYRDLPELPLPADEAEERERSSPKTATGKPVRPPTPTLKRIGVNLGEMARNGELERAHERKQPIDELLSLTSGKRKQAVAVVGSTAVGKTTILNELAHRIAHEKEDPKECRPVFFVDASRLVAGDNWFGDWQRQTLDVLEECEAADVVWFAGNLLPLLDAGKNISSEQSVSMLMKPALTGRRVTIVGECSTATWSQLSLRDAGFARLFTAFRVDEPEAPEAERILKGVAADQEREYGVRIGPDALRATSELSKRYTSDGSRLGAAAHLLRRVCEAQASHDDETLPEQRPALGRSAIVRYFCSETGLPEFLVRDELPLDADEIAATFKKRLIGQSHVVALMADLVTVIKAGLSDLGRPLGSFLFVGPTGVGKTETAKTLAAFLFGSEQRLTRFDMSEFSGWDAVHRFLGRQDQEGKLVAAVRRRPFSVVLLDEIEKANPAIFDVLLQMLGEARLTDEAGRTADFRNVVVIMTSNLGVESLKRAVGFDTASLQEQYRAHFLNEAQKFFRPELFNRLDHIVPFLPLGAEAIRAITARELSKFLRREGLRQRNLNVVIGDDILAWLAHRGVDERYGARPLKRVMERQLTSGLARQLADSFPEGSHEIQVEPADEALTFSVRGGKSSTTVDIRPLEAFVARVQDLRFRYRCWIDTQSFREAQQKLRLLDRLSQSKRFWEDQDLAEARLAGVEVDRMLVDNLTELGQRINSLDDLAHDAYFSREASALPDLKTEWDDIQNALANHELALHGRHFETNDAVTLFMTSGNFAHRLVERLVTTYSEFAREKEWRVSMNLLRYEEEEPEYPPKPKKPPRSSKSKGNKGRKPDDEEAANDASAPKVTKKQKKKLALKWQWPSPEAIELEDPDDSLRRVVARLLDRGLTDDIAALFVEGRHATTMLLEEAGHHQRVTGDGIASVAIHSRPGVNRAAPSVEFVTGPLTRLRTIDERRNLVEDNLLGLHYPLEPRLWRVYERFMRARPFKKAFGEHGLSWFRAWEAS